MINKLKMKSRDVVGGNVEKIAALFPHCVTERIGKNGTAELAIDFDKLRAELSNDALEDGEERYQFTWPDKRAASRLANEPVNLTLRPCREESVDFDTTENLYIEGDNLDVLKVLRETYLGRVKMIYIDPPYNTGNDFVYNDDFAQGKEDFEQNSGLFDADGNQTIDPMQRNTEANGRFHTDWLNMIYPRLKVARDLLTEDGVIFISIDDSEYENIKKLCDEIFGPKNFIANCIRRTINSGKHDSTTIAPFHEYVLMYSKNANAVALARKAKDAEERDRLYKESDEYVTERGRYYVTQLNKNSLQYSDGLNYPIEGPDGVDIWPGEGFHDKVWVWRWSKQKVQWGIENGYIIFKKAPTGKYKVYTKSYEFRDKDGNPIDRSNPYSSLEFIAKEYANFNATPELERIFDGKKIFDFPKSQVFLKELIKLGNFREGFFLDFFSGSATSAHSLLELNAEDGGKRKFILVQLPEVTDEKSEARKAGYANICEIGKERIRRAGKKVKEEAGLQGQSLDTGFRVLKLDSSNMEDVFYTPDKFEPSLLDSLVDNIKADRSGEDLLFQVMLDLGIELSVGIRREAIGGKECWIVDEGYLIACFDKDVNETTIEEMAKLLPTHLVIRDASAANDNVLDNFDQIIESYSNEKKITTHIL